MLVLSVALSLRTADPEVRPPASFRACGISEAAERVARSSLCGNNRSGRVSVVVRGSLSTLSCENGFVRPDEFAVQLGDGLDARLWVRGRCGRRCWGEEAEERDEDASEEREAFRSAGGALR